MKNIILAVLLLGTLVGCLKSSENTFTCTYNACAEKAPTQQIEQVQAYLSTKGIAAIQHCSGLFYVIDTMGTGATPTVCSDVLVRYEGKLANDTVFESTTSPVAFNLSRLITGFKNGIPLIKEGGRIRLFIPPALGYGSVQAGSIPPNSMLIFDVSLLATR